MSSHSVRSQHGNKELLERARDFLTERGWFNKRAVLHRETLNMYSQTTNPVKRNFKTFRGYVLQPESVTIGTLQDNIACLMQQ